MGLSDFRRESLEMRHPLPDPRPNHPQSLALIGAGASPCFVFAQVQRPNTNLRTPPLAIHSHRKFTDAHRCAGRVRGLRFRLSRMVLRKKPTDLKSVGFRVAHAPYSGCHHKPKSMATTSARAGGASPCFIICTFYIAVS